MPWPTALLGEMCQISIGRTPSRSKQSYWGSGHRWLSIADMNQGRDLRSTKEQITDSAATAVMGRPSPPGTVMFSFKLSIGKVGISSVPLYTNEAIASLPILDSKLLLPEFLYWTLRSLDFSEGANRAAMGNTLNKAQLKLIEIPLPSIDEQRRIADILDRADALRAKRREALAHIDHLSRALFLDMFVVRSHWDKRPLGDLVKLKSGDFLPASAMAQGGQFAVLGGNGINGHHDQYLFDEPRIVIGRVGVYCGCIHVSPPKAWVTDNALYVSSMSDALEMDYLAAALRHANLNQYASQSGQPLISGSRIYPVTIPVPPAELQSQYVERERRMLAIGETQADSLKSFEALFASLQQRAFIGQV